MVGDLIVLSHSGMLVLMMVVLVEPTQINSVQDGIPCASNFSLEEARLLAVMITFAHAAMSFLIPIGVVIYAAIGGLKATFTTSYMHMVIVFCLTLIFMFKVYVPGNLLGGIDDVGHLPRSLHGLPLALKASLSLVHTGLIPASM